MTLRIPGRVVFIIPWPGHWIIGTTDHADTRRPEEVAAPEPAKKKTEAKEEEKK